MPRLVLALLSLLVGSCSGVVAPPSSGAAPGASGRPATVPPSRPVTPPAASPSASNGIEIGRGEAWIVYQLWNGRADIRLVRPDGTGDHPLLREAGRGSETTHPDWSPDGARIAYVADNAIWLADATGTDVRRVSAPCRAPCSEDYPAWSPDGTSIAYGRWQADGNIVANGTIVVIDLSDGSETTVLTTDGPEYPAYPRWSPDGLSMVIELDRFSNTSVDSTLVVSSEIATFDVRDGATSIARRTEPEMFAAYPDWSPSGDRIVFSTYDLGYRDAGAFAHPVQPSDLYTMAPDGTGRNRLTANGSGPNLVRNGTASGPLSTQPTWTPDGRSIIFVQVDGPTWPGWQLSSMRPDVTGLAPVPVPPTFQGTHPRLRPIR